MLAKCSALVVVAALLAGTAGSDGLNPVARHEHHAQKAPEQRWGSAAGQSHVVGRSGNHTVPKTSRAKYPLRPASAAPAASAVRNKATVAAPPKNPVNGFNERTSREVPARRGVHQRVFRNADGSETTEFSAAPVNYRRPDGTWAPIDERLVPAGTDPAGSGWRNAADSIGVRVAPRADAAELARVSLDAGHAVGFGLRGAKHAKGRVVGATVTYPDVLPGVDVRLDAQGGGVKETLVLASRDAPRSFVFPLSLTGLSAGVAGGQVVLTDAAGRRRAVFPAGVMTDSATSGAGPAMSTGVRYELVTTGGRPALRVSVDDKWLTDPDRVFPVLVDPSVAASGADSSMVVHGGSSTSGSSELLVGRVDGAAAAAYLKFTDVATQLRFHTIYGAQLSVVDFDAASCKARPVTVHPVTQAWSGTSGFSYPGPSVGAAMTSKSFAYGHIGLGQSRSSCPAKMTLFDLGSAGKKLVQGWVNGGANNGISLRASATDELGWKRLAGSGTANAPKLYVTHSPYNAKYSIPNPVPNPPVLQNQSGQVKVTVTNLSAETWTPSTYYLAYRAYDAETGKAVTQQRSANLAANLARGAKTTLTATIKPLPPGKYFLDFTMVRTGGVVFTDEQVPPARIVLEVIDIPPVVQELFPPNGYPAQTLTPQLWAQALDIDAPPGSSLRYKFEVCDTDGAGTATTCTTSPYGTSPAWTVPAGQLVWSKTYLWRAFVKDATTEVPSPRSALLTNVPQPAITSHIAAAPYGSQAREFDPQVGNFSTVAVDASVANAAGPAIRVVRTYNSLDPRRGKVDAVDPLLDAPFGAGWRTQFDMRLTPDDDGSGNVVISYPDGQEVRFGKNPDGSYAAPPGRTASLTFDGTSFKLLDKARTTYTFAGSGGRLTRISDASSHSLVLTYNSQDGTLAKVQVSNSQTNTAGRALLFTWSGGHVATVRTDPVDGAALTWTYTYAGDLLTKVCAPGSICTTYAYGPGSHYRSAVLDDRPESYWRLGEPSGATGAGSEVAVNLGKDSGTYHNVTLEAPGGTAGSTDTAATFNGTSSYLDLPKGTVKKSRDAAVEVWFKANVTGAGGPLIGYQDKAVGSASTIGVPLLYHGSDGLLRGQFWNGTIAPMTSTKQVNDGRWHHAVLSSMGDTQTLYLDGARMATTSNSATVDTSALTVNQVGAAYATSPASWPGWGAASQRYYSGTIDEVALYTHPLGPAAVKAHYDHGSTAADQLTSVTLPSGRVAAAAEYDQSTGRLTDYTDRNGGTWTLGAPAVYGGDADLRRGVALRDPAGRPYLYEYDALTGQMVRSGTPTGLVVKDEDKTDATPSSSPSPSPTTTCTSPDPGDPQFCTTIPGGSGGPVFEGHDLDGMAIRSYEYDDRGNQNVVTNENGDKVWMTYDDRGNVTSRKTCRTGSECYTEYYSYPTTVTDPFDPRNDLPTEHRDGRSSSATDNRYLTRYTYHPTGQLLTQTNPDNSTVRHTYTNGTEAAIGGTAPSGLILTTTDPRGAVTRYGYYHNGDLAKITEPSGLATSYTYDALGRKITETETSDAYPSGVTTTYIYDAMNHVTSTTEPATTDAVTGVRHQGRTTTTYDADGNVTSVTASDLLGGDAPRTTTYDYDDHGRVDRVTDPEGDETSYSYDRSGNKTAMVDANGNRFEYGYTARNMLAEVRLRDWSDDPDGAPDPAPGDALVLHSYAYDLAGRMARDIDAMGRRLEYAYYGDDLLESVTLTDFHNPDGTARRYVVQSNTYDGAGNLTREVTANGQLTTDHVIDVNGQETATVVDPGGLARRTAFTYDSAGNVTKVATSGGWSNVPWTVPTAAEEVSYSYDLAGNRTEQTQINGSRTLVTSYAYDQRGLLTSMTDPRGNAAGADKAAYTTTYGYDEMGRQTAVTGPAVQAESDGNPAQTVHPTQTVGYDTYDEPVATKDELGNITRTAYDRLGRATTLTEPSYTPPGGGTAITPVTRSSYDALGNVTETIDPRGNATRYRYDRLNRMVERDEPAATNDDRAKWRYTYTRTGEVLSVTDPTGARVESTYDDLDRQATLTQVERLPVADNFTTRYGYDDAGNLTSAVSPTGATATNTYDKAGELTRSKDPSGVITQYGYDFTGRQVRISDGLGRTSRTDFDAFGRVAAESDLKPDGSPLRSQSYAYDEAGNVVSSTDPLNHTTTYAYDAADQLTRQVEPVSDTESITTGFGYDAAGNRTRYTDGRGNSTIYTVNTLGLPESVIEPATSAHPALPDRTWTATYDAAANPVRLAAPGGVTRDRTFDAAGRLTAETGAGASAATAARARSYDKAGRLTKASAPGGDNTYAYNDRGGLLSADGPSGTATFGYDGDGNQTSRTDKSGTSQFGYVAGRLASVTDGITGGSETLSYDAAGLPKSVDYGAGRVRSFGYDELGRLSSDELKNAAGQTVASIGYGRDLNDNLTGKTTTGTAGAGDNSYGYDFAGRLTSWTNGAATTDYGWDAAGNRIKDGSKTASYDARNRLISDGDYTYSYTPRGTLAAKTSSGMTESFSFDAFDRLISGGGETYGYDGLDRVASRNGTAFDYAGLETDPVADGTASYARDPAGELLAVAEGQNKEVTLADDHGDIVGGFDPADTTLNTLKSSTAYDPFGNQIAESGPDMGNVGFQGDWTDPQTDQVNMGARWYDPGTGAFDSRDDATYSAGPSILANRYTYGAGDPLDNTDPDGNWPSCGWCHKAVHAVTHAVSSGASWVYHNVVQPAWHYAYSAVRTVVHAVVSAAKWVYDKGKAAASWVGHKIAQGARWVASKAAAAYNWARQKAAAAKRAAVAAAKAVTRKARAAAAWVAKHNPLPVIASAVRPIYSGLKKVISSAAHVAAQVVSTVRDVVADVAKTVQVVYQKAVDAAGAVVQTLSTAVHAVSEFVQAHAATIAGFAAGALVGVGCGLAIGWTGVGAVACGALAGAVGSVVHDMVEGGHSWREMLGNAVIGAAFGGITGGLASVGGQFLGAGARAVLGGAGLRAAGQSAISAARTEAGNIIGGRITGGLASRLTGGLGRAVTCRNSFVAGTAVLMADGTRKPIEQVAAGDEVKATDPTTGKTAGREVTDTITGTGDKHLVAVTIDTDGAKGGKVETLTATDGHPFWVTNLHRWVEAKDLKPGYRLETADHRDATVTGTRAWSQYQSVYNLTVDATHTYYVTAGTQAVLVHNCGLTNNRPEGIQKIEVQAAAARGVSPRTLSEGAGMEGLQRAIGGASDFKWGVTMEGELKVVPAFAGGGSGGPPRIEIAHTVLAGVNGRLRAAGSGTFMEGFPSFITNQSGHFLPGAETLPIGEEAFERAGIDYISSVFDG